MPAERPDWRFILEDSLCFSTPICAALFEQTVCHTIHRGANDGYTKDCGYTIFIGHFCNLFCAFLNIFEHKTTANQPKLSRRPGWSRRHRTTCPAMEELTSSTPGSNPAPAKSFGSLASRARASRQIQIAHGKINARRRVFIVSCSSSTQAPRAAGRPGRSLPARCFAATDCASSFAPADTPQIPLGPQACDGGDRLRSPSTDTFSVAYRAQPTNTVRTAASIHRSPRVRRTDNSWGS
jgi:hypothetical protein